MQIQFGSSGFVIASVQFVGLAVRFGASRCDLAFAQRTNHHCCAIFFGSGQLTSDVWVQLEWGRNLVDKYSIRVLIVDDYEAWRRYFSTTLRKQQGLQVVGEVSDGLEAVQEAERLQPDLILLDIGLPTLNGIEAARRIREVSPASKILFVSDNRSADIAADALSTGAGGYMVKSDAVSELLPAVKAVLEGKRFVSTNLGDHRLNGPPDPQTGARFHRDKGARFAEPRNLGSTHNHEVGFYSEDRGFLDGFTGFIGAALMAGKAVIVVTTESHRDSLLVRLRAHGLNMDAAIKEGRYVSLDAAETLSTFMVNGLPDPVRFQKATSDLIVGAAQAVNGEPARVAACGECAPLLWAQGNMEAAIRVEHLWDEISRAHGVEILCGYSVSSFQGGVDSYAFEKICSVHSAFHFR
jgi:DNA-binding NarL/FixJ family response regulator